MGIINKPSVDKPVSNVNRAAIEHRAIWMGLIYDELVKAGVDAEPILRKAIRRCGLYHGEISNNACNGSKDCRIFAELFAGELDTDTFEIESKKEENSLECSFHFCPLVSGWKKIGFSDERIALLCDIAMEGDRAIAEKCGLDFDLGDTIANGCETCEIKMKR